MNARKEFIEHVEGKEVKCVILNTMLYEYSAIKEKEIVIYTLKQDYSKNDYEAFLKSISFQYDEGYGGQELFGTIWYKDGSFSDRGEYDGSEWWEHRESPKIPKELV